MEDSSRSRRSLIIGAGSAVAALGLASRAVSAQPASTFKPPRHPEDAWLDQRPGTHRIFIDAATANGAGEAILYANNLYNAQQVRLSPAARISRSRRWSSACATSRRPSRSPTPSGRSTASR